MHTESWTKVTVVLFDRQIAYLDGVVQAIRARSGASISRAQLIRALVDAACEAHVDLSVGGSEAELRAALVERLSARHGSELSE
jgi:phosphoribosylamine-glycine ligase